jgi:hypothetical protein
MRLFHPDARTQSDRAAREYALFEIAYTTVDFAAAALFVVGSVLFFYEATTYAGTWLFLIGSVCFALKPTIRLTRELNYWRRGDVDDLAERQRD